AWAIVRKSAGSDDPLTRWGHAVAARRGKRIAVIALARRLAGVLWAMWKGSTVYDAARVGIASAKGIARHAQGLETQAEAMKRAAAKERVRCRVRGAGKLARITRAKEVVTST